MRLFLQLLRTRAKQLCYFYVYGYRHPVTKVWRYIGKGHTWGSYDRKNRHLYSAKSTNVDSHFVNWLRVLLREGLTPEIVVIREGMSTEHAYAYEKELIARIGRTCDGGTLYNLDSGGLGGRRFSEEHKQKISKALIGVFRSEETRHRIKESHVGFTGKHHSDDSCRRISDALKGRVVSEETRDKQSEARKGAKHTEETKQRLRAINLGKAIAISQREAISKAQKLRWTRFREQRVLDGYSN